MFRSSEDRSVVISNACIPDVSAGAAPTRLFANLVNGPENILVTTLVPGIHESEMLNFKVPLNGAVTLRVVGAHPIHLIGYMNLIQDASDIIMEEEEEEDIPEE